MPGCGPSPSSLMLAKPNKEDLSYLAGLVEAGELTPVIDKRYELSEVPEALRSVGEANALGKVVIAV